MVDDWRPGGRSEERRPRMTGNVIAISPPQEPDNQPGQPARSLPLPLRRR